MRRKTLVILLVVFFFALLLRLPLVFSVDRLQTDSASYYRLALAMDSGWESGDAPFRVANPVFAWTWWLALKLPLDHALGVRLLNVLFGCLTAVAAVFLGRRMGGDLAGVVSGLLVAAWYHLVLDSITAMSEPLFTLLSLMHVLLLLRWADRPRSIWPGLLVGGTAGLALLLRGNGIVYAPLAAALIAFGWSGFGKLPSGRRLAAAALLLGVAAMFWAGPRVWASAAGESLPNQTIYPFHDGTNLALTNREETNYRLTADGEERQFTREVRGSSIPKMILDHPKVIARKYAKNLEKTVNEVLPELFFPFIPLLLPAFVVGLFLLFRSRRDLFWLVVLYSIPWVLLMPLIQVRHRHFFGVLPLWIGAVAVLYTTLRGMCGTAIWRRRALTGTLALFLGAAVLCSGYVYMANRGEANEYRFAGEWLCEHTPSDAAVFCRDSELEVHARGRRAEILPYAELPAMLDYGVRRGVTYLVVADWERRCRPQLGALARGEVPAEVSGRVELLATLSIAGRKPVLIYAIR